MNIKVIANHTMQRINRTGKVTCYSCGKDNYRVYKTFIPGERIEATDFEGIDPVPDPIKAQDTKCFYCGEYGLFPIQTGGNTGGALEITGKDGKKRYFGEQDGKS